MASNYAPRPPLLPWTSGTWSTRWSSQGRLSTTPILRTPFLLLKAPASTLYEEKFGGDRNMFTVGMYCSRMMARGIRIGLVVDCTALDLEEFEPLPDTATTTTTAGNSGKKSSVKKKKNVLDRRVRYFHNPSEWDDFDVEYYRLMPPKSSYEENDNSQEEHNEPLASQVLGDFFRVVINFIQKSRSATGKSEGNSTITHISLFDSRGGLGVASYLAAAYMCHALKAPVHAALEAVKEGSPSQPSPSDSIRKWGLCDLRLVKDLQTRFKGSREIVMEGGVPSWWWAVEDEDDNEDEGEVKDGDLSADTTIDRVEIENSGKRKLNDERIVIPPCCVSVEDSANSKRPRTNSDMLPPSSKPGLFPVLPREALEPVSIDSSKAIRAMTVLAQLTQSSLPLTLLPFKPEVDISNITSLENSDSNTNNILQSMKSSLDRYKVTWLSTHGRRGLLLILSEAIYFIERQTDSSTNNPSPISVSVVTTMKFPSAKDPQIQQHRTLLDVVLVHDVEKTNQCYRFYILDILCIEGGMVWHKSWKERWRFLNDGVLMPRKKEEAKQLQQHSSSIGHKYQKEPIRIRAKEYFPLQKLEYVINDVCAVVGHEAKGVRIVPMGAYGIHKEHCTDENREAITAINAAVWKRGGSADEQQLISLLLR
ncbi:hypothetical protein HJC23_003556 [Cyclotella cryptica]|uniref:mRNA capping enzyme adenylation domain-containing protein n=1 Tax=Cyclotella cryptica TaxID=29204 RepID=A0ABD3PJ67_9STRA|eukprot:CCRYP_014197-RA/>CCRYP_014197-RA protein AED:0.01 eAED:0.01 QI:216/1/1/1/1/1/2/2154/649